MDVITSKERRLTTAVLILLVTDTCLAIAGVVLRQRMEGRMQKGFTTGFVVCGAALLIHCLGAAPLALAVKGSIIGQATFLRYNGLLGFVPAVVFARFFLEAVSTGSVDAIFGLNTGMVLESDFSKAKARERGGDIAGAIDEYRRYFKEDARSPQALFEIGRLQTREQQFNDAADTYRQIIGRFRENDDVWARASVQLAELLEQYLHEKGAAHSLLRQVLKRAPKSRHAQFARERLLPREEQPDHFYREP